MKSIFSYVTACCLFMQLCIAQQTAGVAPWRSVSSRSPGDVLKITLKDGSTVKGMLKSASDTGLVLERKNRELSVPREEVGSVSVLTKESAGKAALIGMALGGGAGAGVGAGVGAAQKNSFPLTRGQSSALGAGVFGGAGAAVGSLVGFAVGKSGHKEMVIYQALPAR